MSVIQCAEKSGFDQYSSPLAVQSGAEWRDIERKNKRTCLKKVCNTLGFHQCKKNKEAKKICIYERKILVKAIAGIAKVAVQARQV